jgi:hypothetical protein
LGQEEDFRSCIGSRWASICEIGMLKDARIVTAPIRPEKWRIADRQIKQAVIRQMLRKRGIQNVILMVTVKADPGLLQPLMQPFHDTRI